jgi:hypothetical protein
MYPNCEARKRRFICRDLKRISFGCVSNELDPIIGRLFSVFWALETFVLRVASTQMKHTHIFYGQAFQRHRRSCG